ncbi:MAG TPA: hypothetical protein VIA62_25280 [Thermoanaerobaculia bacterium]|jgi:hypothetical protein|nr:hypothetical protein [Thermoanaerobaculia bacterium]
MEPLYDSCTEILSRLLPVLPAVFSAFGISEAEAKAILENACRTLVSKRRLRLQEPQGWLLRTVIEACRRSAEEERVEDPSA